MPSRNVIKELAPDSYFHVYGRGVSRSNIFFDDEDYAVFLNLFKRYLSPKPAKDRLGREYPHLRGNIELISYCLMPNHFHMMVYQYDEHALTRLMRGILTSYVTYFNRKYRRSGPLFESRYKASKVDSDAYLMHITRYIHLNPSDWRKWKWSSLRDYTGEKSTEWLETRQIADLFHDKKSYNSFVEDYEDIKELLKMVKHELAGE